MVNQKKAVSKFSEIELWAMARIVAGQSIPDDLPIGDTTYRLIRDLSFLSIEWRGQTLAQSIGADTIRAIQGMVNKPMPVYEIGPGIAYTAPAYGSPPGQSPQPPPMVVPQRQHLIYADELKRLPTPKYALQEYPIYQQCLNVLVGPSGAGKSFIAVDIAGKMATQGAVVIYIAGEGLFGYSARWEVWKAFHHLSNCPNLIFYDQPVNFMNEAETLKFVEEVSPKKPTMIIVDTVARCMVGADENSTRDMGMFVGTCDKLIHTLGTGVLGIHHTGKDGKMRGNSSLFGASDSVLFLRRDELDITVFNSLDMGGKNKNSQEADPIRLTLIPQSATTDGKLFESAVLVDSYKVTADAVHMEIKGKEKIILEALDTSENGMTIEQVCDATSIPKSSVYRRMNNLKKLGLVEQSEDKYLITETAQNTLYNH